LNFSGVRCWEGVAGYGFFGFSGFFGFYRFWVLRVRVQGSGFRFPTAAYSPPSAN
jgi:hypothetical protein